MNASNAPVEGEGSAVSVDARVAALETRIVALTAKSDTLTKRVGDLANAVSVQEQDFGRALRRLRGEMRESRRPGLSE